MGGIVSMLRMHGSIPPLPHYTFMAWYFGDGSIEFSYFPLVVSAPASTHRDRVVMAAWSCFIFLWATNL